MVLHNLLSQAEAVNQEQLLSDCFWPVAAYPKPTSFPAADELTPLSPFAVSFSAVGQKVGQNSETFKIHQA